MLPTSGNLEQNLELLAMKQEAVRYHNLYKATLNELNSLRESNGQLNFQENDLVTRSSAVNNRAQSANQNSQSYHRKSAALKQIFIDDNIKFRQMPDTDAQDYKDKLIVRQMQQIKLLLNENKQTNSLIQKLYQREAALLNEVKLLSRALHFKKQTNKSKTSDSNEQTANATITLQAQNNGLQKLNEQLQRELDELKSQKIGLDTELHTFIEKFSMKKAKLHEAKSQNQQIKKELNNLVKYIDQSETALHQQIRELQGENRDLEQRERALLANINTLEQFKNRQDSLITPDSLELPQAYNNFQNCSKIPDLQCFSSTNAALPLKPIPKTLKPVISPDKGESKSAPPSHIITDVQTVQTVQNALMVDLSKEEEDNEDYEDKSIDDYSRCENHKHFSNIPNSNLISSNQNLISSNQNLSNTNQFYKQVPIKSAIATIRRNSNHSGLNYNNNVQDSLSQTKNACQNQRDVMSHQQLLQTQPKRQSEGSCEELHEQLEMYKNINGELQNQLQWVKTYYKEELANANSANNDMITV